MAASPAMEKLHKMVATSAIHDGERDEKADYTGVCHPGTREEHLENLKAWAGSIPPETRLEWVYAIAGTGKTAMFRTFCIELEEKSGFPSISFFVWKGDDRRNTLKFFPATIAAQLCRRIPALVPHIEKAINEDPFLLQSAFKKQMEKLVIRPLLDCSHTIKDERHLIIVVDGLDELDAKGQAEVFDFVPYLLSRLSSLPISLLVSSRPDPQIVGAFKRPGLASITRGWILGASDEDIRKFLDDKLDDINLRHPYLQIEHGSKWPSHEKREIMVRQSSGLFIWPTVAIGHIDKVEKGLGHNKRLEQVLSSANPKPWVASPLDKLYRAILEAHAPEDRTSFEFYCFKRRLALVCIIDLGNFVIVWGGQEFDWSDTLVRALFDESLDELWDSVIGLSSLLSPRKPLSHQESPTPGVLHHSLRDFTFTKARCGEELYYSSEQELHAEIACKILKSFNTRQAYQSGAEMGAWFFHCVGELLEIHLKEAAVSAELGCYMDDITLDYVPSSWPLVIQVYVTVALFGGLYTVAEHSDFPEGSRRREALLSRVIAFIKLRSSNAQELDTALFRLVISTTDFRSVNENISLHSVRCWHVARSPQCTCIDAYIRHASLYAAQKVFCDSTLFQHCVRSRLVENRGDDIAEDSFYVLQFFLSLSETSQRAIDLSPFISVTDVWIIDLLKHCPPNDELYNTLGPTCTAPLPDLPKREGDDSSELVRQFLIQTAVFNEYAECCQKVGIETKFPSIKIPDDWWQDKDTRVTLLGQGYKPPFDIPDEWWEDETTRGRLFYREYKPPCEIQDEWWQESDWARVGLLDQGYKPPVDIPDEWWQEKWARVGLLDQGYKPAFNIPDEWWKDEATRGRLLFHGYKPSCEIQDEWWRESQRARLGLLCQGYKPPFDIPDEWWQKKWARVVLLNQGYEPPFDIPAEWWEDEVTRGRLLFREYKPPCEIQDEWWQESEWARVGLLNLGYKPPSDIPDEWWKDKDTRQVLRRRGYPPPDPYSAEETASEGEDEDEVLAVQGVDRDQPVSRQDKHLTAGGETLSRAPSPSVEVPHPPPAVALSNPPLHIPPASPAHPATTPVQTVGRRRRGLRYSLRDFILRR